MPITIDEISNAIVERGLAIQRAANRITELEQELEAVKASAAAKLEELRVAEATIRELTEQLYGNQAQAAEAAETTNGQQIGGPLAIVPPQEDGTARYDFTGETPLEPAEAAAS